MPRRSVLVWAEGLLLIRGAVTDIEVVFEVAPEASDIVAELDGVEGVVARPALHRPADPAAFDAVEDELRRRADAAAETDARRPDRT